MSQTDLSNSSLGIIKLSKNFGKYKSVCILSILEKIERIYRKQSKGHLINSLYLLCLYSFQYFSEQFIQIKYAFAATTGRIFKEHLQIASNVETSANVLSLSVRLGKTSFVVLLFFNFKNSYGTLNIFF